MSSLAHILTSRILQSESGYISLNLLYPITPTPARYVVAGLCETLTIGPEVHGASNIYRIVDRWLSDNVECDAPVVGVRVDPDTYDVHVDMCTVTPLASIARLRAKDRGEKEIWDMVDNVAIPVYNEMTWRELATKISSLPDEVLDSPALVFDSQDISHRVKSLTSFDADEPVSVINLPSIDLQ